MEMFIRKTLYVFVDLLSNSWLIGEHVLTINESNSTIANHGIMIPLAFKPLNWC